MVKKIREVIGAFVQRTLDDHMGSYAATCAFFLILSFVPLIMILLVVIRKTHVDETFIMNGIISIVPAGIKDYIATIINEVYIKPFTTVPISIFMLLWSASKVIHALTNGLNVINHVKETRGWWYLRFRSMILVGLMLLVMVVLARFMFWGAGMSGTFSDVPILGPIVDVLRPFKSLVGYAALIMAFDLIYTLLPNERSSFKSQLPGALLIATVWMMVSYVVTIYYTHTNNFATIYGSLTGIILAMIWVYFCMYFLLVGAELNRIILENPEDNMILNTIQDVKEESKLRKEAIRKEIERQKRESTDEIFKTAAEREAVLNSMEDHEVDEETGIDLSLVRSEVYRHDDELWEEEDE
ncbi:MAG: YihY/virulence factor BrkB family protein [Lachnospiraceae bacterium]|nr:YihY/virulence factor BrkB family protein [Lachnospiraceae bacterium]